MEKKSDLRYLKGSPDNDLKDFLINRWKHLFFSFFVTDFFLFWSIKSSVIEHKTLSTLLKKH